MPPIAGTWGQLAGSGSVHDGTDATGKPVLSNTTFGQSSSPESGSIVTALRGNPVICTASVCAGIGVTGVGRSMPAIEHASLNPVSCLQTEMYGAVGSPGGKIRIARTASHAMVTSEHLVAAMPVSVMQLWTS